MMQSEVILGGPQVALPVGDLAVRAFGLGGLKQDGVVGGLEHIGVLGSAELGVHDDVEDAQVVVQRAGKIKAGFEL